MRINFTHTFDNGLVLLAEQMDWAESVAFSMLVPSGFIHDPPNREGLASVTCDMVLRGAGPYSSRSLTEALEHLGCEHGETAGHVHTSFSAATLAANLFPALELLAEMVQRPHLPEDELDFSKQILLQEILSVEDEPARKVMLELGKIFYPKPWGNTGFGTIQTVENVTIDDVRNFQSRYSQSCGAILSVAGRIHWESLRNKVGQLFADWSPNPPASVVETADGRTVVHIPADSAQTHLAVVYPSLPFGTPDYLLAWAGYSALSDGMSSRLFTEIREKRGLSYSVGASYMTLQKSGGIVCYCGTAAERAQETLQVLLDELARLSDGITQEELERIRIRAKTSLVMQQESVGGRSGSMSRDWYHLGRIRTMEEIESQINGLTVNRVNDYLAANPAGPFHFAVLGPEPLLR